MKKFICILLCILMLVPVTGMFTNAEQSAAVVDTPKESAEPVGRIVCWGDSFTQGLREGFHDISPRPYPTALSEILGVEALNFGIGGDTAEAIAMRQGGVRIYLDDVTIPSTTEWIPVTVIGENGYSPASLAQNGDVGLNNVSVGGIEGELNWNSDYARHEFRRIEEGEELVITEPTQIITAGMSVPKNGDVLVMCIGANNRSWSKDSEEDFQTLIDLQTAIIDYAATDEFIIIAFPSIEFLKYDLVFNEKLAEYWGEHFVDFNEYLMSDQCFEDHNIEKTGPDKKDIKAGLIPRSFLSSDKLHPNQIGYDIISDFVAQRIKDLGYLEEKADFDPEMSFVDTACDSWYYSSVKYCYKNGLMKGTSQKNFRPEGVVTREMFVQTLANIEGIDTAKYENKTSFTDVQAGQWYSAAIEWAKQNKIVEGTSATTFGLGISVTREQMAKMFRSYAEYKGESVGSDADLNAFTDSARISSWAKEGVGYAVSQGLFKGNEKNQFNPQGKATRMELATVLYRYHYKSVYGIDAPDASAADSLLVEAESSQRFVCWGDSLTVGSGLTPFPALLQERFGIRAQNYGVGGEGSGSIAGRQGAKPIYVQPFTIPAASEAVEVQMVDAYGEEIDIGYFGTSGLNPVEIGGVSGSYYYDQTNERFVFKRSQAGAEVKITQLTRVITSGMKNRRENDILILFLGTNNRYSTKNVDELIRIQEEMIKYSGSKKYIIVGFTSKDYMSEVDEVNAVLKEYWGKHFVDLREYMMTEQCLIDCGITPTEDDLADLENGEIPSSLRTDSVHGNQHFYNIIADMIGDQVELLHYVR
ncbi:MAG: S-layer homology domain-containing protein [Clostridia bacterium]|nr:S-layer homology domain-containing protein [Clostridia bacterium]